MCLERISFVTQARFKESIRSDLSGIETSHIHLDPEEEDSMFLRCIGIPSIIFNNVTIQKTVSEQPPSLTQQNIPRLILTVAEPAGDVQFYRTLVSETLPHPSSAVMLIFPTNVATFPPNRIAIIFTQTFRVKPK